MKQARAISSRGATAAVTELRTDLELYFEASNDTWSPKNVKGKFPLNMAENNLNWEMMSRKIGNILSSGELPKWVSNYTGIGGEEKYLASLANFMSKYIGKCEISPDNLVTSAGATAVIELASWVLCDPGDVAVIPAPSYPVYTQDIGNKSQVHRYDLVTHHELSEIKDGPNLSTRDLDKTLKKLSKKGQNFRLLIITSPDNPSGNSYPNKALKKIAKWCEKNEVHLIVNELYALSMINGHEHASFAKIMKNRKSDFLHMIYGLSKDFGISGFRVGLFHSYNKSVLSAYRNLNAPSMVSNVTQYIVSEVFSDEGFIQKYIKVNQKKISVTYNIVSKTLTRLGINHVSAHGSLFVWLDLSPFLTKPTKKAEHKFWLKLYKETGILLTPANGFGNSKRGQYRLVHSFLAPEALHEAMGRFSKFIAKKSR